jgi:multiple sugar transport system ATP-binding protein
MSKTYLEKDPKPTSDAIIINNLRKEFDDVVAVDEIDLKVQRGELLVLLGPSGCGKSTVLRMVAGLEVPTNGEILLDNVEITDNSPQERDISMVFQSYALYPHKTVTENLKFPLDKTELSESQKESQIQQTAEILEITDLLKRKPDQLSGGQRQRVAIGRAIVREPKAFLMDEPLSNLDARLRVQTRAEISDLQQRLDTTTIYVTHDQEEAMSIADRLAIMNDGIIEQVDTPRVIYENPRNEFVAGFLGEPKMNFLNINWAGRTPTIFTKNPVNIDSLLSNCAVPESAASLGIRPTDIYPANRSGYQASDSKTGSFSSPIQFSFELIDPLGHSYELSVNRGNEMIVAVVEDRPTADLGVSIKLRLDEDQIHWFNGQGVAIQ